MDEMKTACRYHSTEEGGGVHQPTCGECLTSHATGIPQPEDNTEAIPEATEEKQEDEPVSISSRRKRK